MSLDPKVQGAALLEKMKAMERAADPGQNINNDQIGGSEAKQFPARYLEPDDRDDYMAIKAELANEKRPAPVTDEDIAAILRKRAAYEVAKQEDWFQHQWEFNSSDPNKQRWAQSVFPEYFARREQVIDEQTLLQNKLAKIKLRGPRSREDLDLLYAIDIGAVKVEDASIFNIKGDAYNAPRRRGIFSPRRAVLGELEGKKHKITNPLFGFPKEGTEIGSFASTRAGMPSVKELAGYK